MCKTNPRCIRGPYFDLKLIWYILGIHKSTFHSPICLATPEWKLNDLLNGTPFKGASYIHWAPTLITHITFTGSRLGLQQLCTDFKSRKNKYLSLLLLGSKWNAEPKLIQYNVPHSPRKVCHLAKHKFPDHVGSHIFKLLCLKS